jgi:hypothetical protein
MLPVSIGFRVHSGWSSLVVCGARPEVILRRRIEIVPPNSDGMRQPFHAAAEMPIADGKLHIVRCVADARKRARREIEQAIGGLTGIRILGVAMTLGSGRLPATLEAILASHPAIHTAEGEHFRAAIRGACEDCGWAVFGIKEKELMPLAGPLAVLAKTLGPPWTLDEKLAALAAWRVSESHTTQA